LCFAYPAAYFLAEKKFNVNKVLVILFIMPMWINFVIRTGATRDLLNWMGYRVRPTLGARRSSAWSTTICRSRSLPLYTTMLKLDHSQMEAAADLGANPWQVFWKNVIPQSLPGIVSACEMVFMPVMSSYVISDTFPKARSPSSATTFISPSAIRFGMKAPSWPSSCCSSLDHDVCDPQRRERPARGSGGWLMVNEQRRNASKTPMDTQIKRRDPEVVVTKEADSASSRKPRSRARAIFWPSRSSPSAISGFS
jgi:hypothetical protein